MKKVWILVLCLMILGIGEAAAMITAFETTIYPNATSGSRASLRLMIASGKSYAQPFFYLAWDWVGANHRISWIKRTTAVTLLTAAPKSSYILKFQYDDSSSLWTAYIDGVYYPAADTIDAVNIDTMMPILYGMCSEIGEYVYTDNWVKYKDGAIVDSDDFTAPSLNSLWKLYAGTLPTIELGRLKWPTGTYPTYGAIYRLPRPIGLSALLSPARISHVCANNGTDLLNYRYFGSTPFSAAPTYKVLENTGLYSVGLNRIAGSLYNYLSNGDAIISYIDGTTWEAANMATVSAWNTFSPKHVCQSGRTQFAVLYKEATTKKLWFSRNFKGTLTDWSAPTLIVGSLASEPNAWIVPQPDGSLICYAQVGTATPIALKNVRADGGAAWS